MRPITLLRTPLWRHTTTTPGPHRLISTAPGTFANLRYELLSRPPKCYYDYLTPTSSHLLSVTLADQLLPAQQHDLPPGAGDGRPYPPPRSSDLDHWSLPKVHRNHGAEPAHPLPQGHHLVYFPPTHPSSALLPDGTDADHWPGPPFTRRLWAGGSLSFAQGWESRLLLDKRRAACVERVEDVRLHWARSGATEQGGGEAVGDHHPVGDKVFVDVVRRYGPVGADEDAVDTPEVVRRIEGAPAVVERRTLVFLTGRADEGASSRGRSRSAKPKLYQDPEHVISFTATPPVLFRFSALSFNAHAIHLDPGHCRTAEGYDKPLVHGPLLLVLMLSALRTAAIAEGRSPLAPGGLEYMNLQPVFVGERMRVCVRPGKTKWHVWVEGEDERLCVKGSAQVA
ncbi:hypothetical protein KVR01_004274 [Diaporthe batatas]|uniref:uncharacterized protein n=1 Tax=Diaporthe batatas TaxID=748121 RepID=UPI001D04D171|nr:uncharacterized protein KVR01_004274 [Diaporthe batatas]KAG8165722.1 hypothetical protein KVR01_004274 [Diaporthe batatas]